ncbi:MAG: DUF5715 family protein [Paludibacter sp.]|nr:DUF5715 family protein [Paludibacter sp.]
MGKKRKKNSFKYLYYILGVVFLVTSGISLSPHLFHRTTKYKESSDCDHVKYADVPIAPSTRLNDLNEVQLVHAEKNGLKEPFKSNEEFKSKIDSLVRKSVLVEVTENRFYQLKTLTHSEPYLIPEAVDMLNDIGYRFQEKLAEKKYNNYRFRITSMLRTEETQSSLSHHNGNATSHSAHLYGTTVDISYKNFYNVKKDSIESSYEAVQTLTHVLMEMRQECRLMVVRERHQSCFHITVVVCGPVPTKNNQQLLSKK